jgi:hypothetical protein
VAAAVLVAGWGAMLALGAPGQLSYDSVVQLADGRSGDYDTWHPPVMAALLGLFDRLLPGTFLYLLFASGLTLAALLWLLWLKPRPGWGTALLALALVLTPQWLLYQSEIWKDVLFADAGLAGFAALARAAADWQARKAWLVASALLLSFAAMARQNGIVLLPVAAITLGIVAARHVGRRSALLHGAVFLVLTAASSLAADALLIARGDGGAGVREQLRYAQSYDLIGMLRADPRLPLPVLKRADPALEALLRGRGVALYSPRQSDSFVDDDTLADAIDRAPAGAIFAEWRALVLRHPLLYLTARGPVFWQVLATPVLTACHPVYVGVDGPAATMKSLGLRRHAGPRALALARYGGAFIGTPFFSHLASGALAVALLIFLARRGGGADIAVAGLLAGALLFALTFLAVSVACDYRYLYFLDISVLAGAFYAARSFAAPVTPARAAPNRL